MRAFTALWDRICRERYGVDGPEAAPLPLRRPGQLARPDRAAAREQRPAHRARDARRDAVGATRGRARSSCRRGTRRSGCRARADQQWSLRIQQILAYETDLLEYADLFAGSLVVEAKTAELDRGAPRPSSTTSSRIGGAFAAIERAEVAARREPDRAGRGASRRASRRVVGVNWFTDAAALAARRSTRRHRCSPSTPASRRRSSRDVAAWRARARRTRAVTAALDALRRAAAGPGASNVMVPTIALALAGGHDRRVGRGAARGLRRVPRADRRRRRARRARGRARRRRASARARSSAEAAAAAARRQARARRALERRRADRRRGARRRLRGRLPGDPPHAARRSRPRPRRGRRRRRAVDPLRRAPRARPRGARPSCARRASRAPVVVGGIIPPGRRALARPRGVRAVFTPKDYELAAIMSRLLDLVEAQRRERVPAAR